MADGLIVVGGTSGGGGGEGYAGGAGAGGIGYADTLNGTSNNDVIFGDGSGAGGGGGATPGAGGLGGGGNDQIFGGDGDDILFGDGFNGGDGYTDGSGKTHGGDGGLGGGGGGGGYYGGNGGIFGGDGGSNGGDGQGGEPATKYTGEGGTKYSTSTSGGTGNGTYSGGGAGFGGMGTGGDAPGYSVYSYPKTHSIYTATDTGSANYNWLLPEVQAGNIYNSTTGTTNGYGAGSDVLDGGAGSDHYFGMGGGDTFVVSEQDNAGTDNDTIWDFSRGDGDRIQLEDASGNVIDSAGIDTLLASADTSSGDTVITMSDGSTVTIKGVTDLTSADFGASCFLPGTLFATVDGLKAIEDLQIGDQLKTAAGFKPLKWLAHRQVNWSMSIARRVAPVQVKAGALGNGLPLRDLFVSPAHALLVDGVLVQAELLVNGTTIVQLLDFNQNFSYFNVELDEHAIVYAEGAAVESYLEVGDNRRSYDNAAEFHARYPQHRPVGAMELGRIILRRQLPHRYKAA